VVDPLGSLLVFKKGRHPRKRPFMACAHMDEVGYLITGIGEDGMIQLGNVGRIDPRVLIGRRMRMGDGVRGVVALKAVHLTTAEERKKVPPLTSLYLDIGASSREEAEKVVSVGDPVAFDSPFEPMGDCYQSKAVDDRVGCLVLLSLLEEELEYDTWFVFSACEEIGSRGAVVAARRIDPGVCLVVEGTTAGDLPDVKPYVGSCSLRRGAVVSLIDQTTVYNREFRQRVTEKADREKIKWQYRHGAGGSTDAGAIHKAAEGAVAFGLSVPVRYIHSANSVVYLPDVEETVKMARLVLREAGECDV